MEVSAKPYRSPGSGPAPGPAWVSCRWRGLGWPKNGQSLYTTSTTPASTRLNRSSPGTPIEFLSGAPGPADLQVGPDGALYYLAGRSTRGVYRVSYIARANEAGSSSAGQVGDGKDNGKCGASGAEVLLFLAFLRLLRTRRFRSA